MISYLQPLTVGNAIRIGVNAAAGASYYRVLRRTDAAFADAMDPGAVIVADMQNKSAVLDIDVENGTEYFYADYSFVKGAWIAGSIGSVTCAASYRPAGVDPQEFVRSRLELGLAVEVAGGALFPQSGSILVLTAPFMLAEGVKFPVVSVHLENYDSRHRFIGDSLFAAFVDGDGDWVGNEGWLSSFTLNIVGTSLNPDERIALRKAIQRVIAGNMGVFAAAGFEEIHFSQRDTEQFTADNAPLYITAGTFECIAPTLIVAASPPLTSVTVNGISASAPDYLEN